MAIKLLSFDVNQTEFPNERSKEIWYLGKNIVPLEISLRDLTDIEMRKGCTQIYQFTREIFSDMYIKHEQYPSQNFDLLFNRFIKFGAKIDQGGFNWIVPIEVYKKYMKQFDDLETILKKFGFKTSGIGNNIILSNEKYPLFLKYWYPFFELCQKRGVSVLSCDFRVFGKKYRLTFDDLLRTQTEKDQAYFIELQEYAIKKGARLDTHNQYRRFTYIYKKEYVLIFGDPCTLIVPYNNQYSRKRDSWVSFDLFMAEIEKQPDKNELIKYVQNEICICNACSGRKVGPKKIDERCGHLLDINGVKRMAAACHPEIGKRKEKKGEMKYTDYDIKMLKRMIDIRIVQINNL
jgi:hypothetical protein